jgi:ATP-dependent DNA helicase RecQ
VFSFFRWGSGSSNGIKTRAREKKLPENALKKYFGFDEFKNGQKAVIGKILAGHSVGAIFPTGAGKSLCYQLPAMMLQDMTLVVSPLLSLMKDQLDFLTARGIPAARLDSTLDREAVNRIFDDAKNGRLKILMVSVERFKNERFRYHLQNMRVSLMAIDEAHCISEWGHNFRPEYLNLPHYQAEFGIPQVLLLTATAPPAVIDDMREKFAIVRENIVVTGFYRSNLFLKVTPTA